jgi:hypothetical protein
MLIALRLGFEERRDEASGAGALTKIVVVEEVIVD